MVIFSSTMTSLSTSMIASLEIICKSSSGFFTICDNSGLSPKETLNFIINFCDGLVKNFLSFFITLFFITQRVCFSFFLSHSNLLIQNRHFLVLWFLINFFWLPLESSHQIFYKHGLRNSVTSASSVSFLRKIYQ